ncbi:MAG: GntR family transcriptional regulator [Desulfomicrobium sp.]|uniref:GntR family transcriptional regulator n=1 Tax=Hoeflea sp. TaxID=1940281 RepID=UPI0025C28271|nr:GntR family transcriptional regulator [Hoeflea sp.]MBU4527136.1 GntR family transcriptional regulator [Alphaproteobacteria bacterium]MBV1713906.1 GntR family transcriptional regulator [Desulfomicrobium sp.]MBU4544118.1 GntR family transcriptional regulator [Alphaproteobacteria bacterium]MBU4552318.1 GntR family transcriptional regulator [Alphaproteobacteria bacterium]MBV1782293.1 GntR family transcriptional regulator [Hoeflea sp.]
MAFFPARLSTSKPPKAAAAFNALKRDIMLGTLAAGTGLTELELAAHFQCSQGTVREALLQLQEEGLVLRKGHRGTQVSECTADEAVEMFRLRTQIECSGLPRTMRSPARSLISDLNAMLEDMLAAADSDDELQLAAIDRDFHRRILESANLPALDPILHRCLVHNHRFKISRSSTGRDLRATALRHRSIIDAIESGDVAQATTTMRHHIATIVDFGPEVFPDANQ